MIRNYKKKAKLTLILAILFGWVPLLMAQTGTISGTVSDDDGGLIGATVQIKGTGVGTTTDFDGNYSFDVDPGTYTLTASYIGFGSQEVEVTVSSNGKATADFTLSEGVAFDEVIVVGSRAAGRTKLTTAVPVDIVDIKKLAGAGAQTNINQILNYVAPSFSSNTQTISDGTDHIDPASLRGLGPDQVLVLINGKRRHTSSLVNVNGTFGRGNVGTDLNAIPVSSIDRIEVLRDGAAAQYGSDAIAGVINIILRENVNTLSASLTTGAFFSEGSNFRTGGSDGESIDLSLNYGVPLGNKGGFINFSGNYESRAFTSRMKEYDGKIFHAMNGIERLAKEDGVDITEMTAQQVRDYAQGLDYLTAQDKSYINAMDDDQIHASDGIVIGTDTISNPLLNDVTNEELAMRGQTRADYNMRVGQSALKGGKFMMNMAIPMGNGAEFYTNAGMSFRAGEAAGFYRLPYQNRTLTSVYIDGFLPQIHSKVLDRNVGAGIKGKVGAWDADFSNTWGANSFRFLIKNTSNASLGKSTPKEFDSGGFSFTQNTTNFDLNRTFDVASGLNFAMGTEFRYENYAIQAGKEDSWQHYDTPSAEDWFGRSRPGGAQVFPGFKPTNELSEYRTSFAGYADVEIDVTDALLFGAAIRYEDYSDFGNTFNYKVVSRYKLTDNWSVRAAFNTGFRAPSLHQIYYNSTSTLFVDGVPSEVGTFSNNSRIAAILGIPSLKEETSQSFSVGFTGRIPSANLSLTIDAYQISIKDRIVLTGTFKPGDDVELQKLFALASAEKATFFANAIDTKSSGLDLVVSHHLNIGNGSSLKTSLSGTFSKTLLDGDIHVSDALAGKESTYFDETSRIYLEKSVPSTKVNLSFNYKMKKLNVFLRGVYFGEVTNATNTVANQQVYAAKTVLDLSLGYQITKSLNLTLGANNLLDVYPDLNVEGNRSSGRFDYSRRAQQFGFAGRYMFARVSYSL